MTTVPLGGGIPPTVQRAYENAQPAIKQRIDELSVGDPSAAARYADALQIQQRFQFAERALSIQPFQLATKMHAMGLTNPEVKREMHANAEGMRMLMTAELAGITADQLRSALAELGARSLLGDNTWGAHVFGRALDNLEAADRVVSDHYNKAARSVPSREQHKDGIHTVETGRFRTMRDLVANFIREQGGTVEETAPPKAKPAREPLRKPIQVTHLAGIRVAFEEGDRKERRVEIGKDGAIALVLKAGQKRDLKTVMGVKVSADGHTLKINGKTLDLSGATQASAAEKAAAAKAKPSGPGTALHFQLGSAEDYQTLITKHRVEPEAFNHAASALLSAKKQGVEGLSVYLSGVSGSDREIPRAIFQRLGELGYDGKLGDLDDAAKRELARAGVFLDHFADAEFEKQLKGSKASPKDVVRATFDLRSEKPFFKIERVDLSA